MAYVEGKSLSQRINEQGPLNPREAAVLIEAAAEAIQHAHDAKVLHRDLKPSNVLLDGQGHVKVADFGLAKILSSGRDLDDDRRVCGLSGIHASRTSGGTHGRRCEFKRMCIPLGSRRFIVH